MNMKTLFDTERGYLKTPVAVQHRTACSFYEREKYAVPAVKKELVVVWSTNSRKTPDETRKKAARYCVE